MRQNVVIPLSVIAALVTFPKGTGKKDSRTPKILLHIYTKGAANGSSSQNQKSIPKHQSTRLDAV